MHNKTLQQMTTIEEIENEIAALKEAREIIENRTGDKFDNSVLIKVISCEIFDLEVRVGEKQAEIDLYPYSPEFDKYDKID